VHRAQNRSLPGERTTLHRAKRRHPRGRVVKPADGAGGELREAERDVTVPAMVASPDGGPNGGPDAATVGFDAGRPARASRSASVSPSMNCITR